MSEWRTHRDCDRGRDRGGGRERSRERRRSRSRSRSRDAAHSRHHHPNNYRRGERGKEDHQQHPADLHRRRGERGHSNNRDSSVYSVAIGDLNVEPHQSAENDTRLLPSCLAGTAPNMNNDNNKRQQEASFQVESNREDDDRRLEQRFKQIGYGKNTVAYDRYIKAVPKSKRQGYDVHPRTPDPYEKVSKRLFDGRIKAWRRKLHDWDEKAPPPEEEMVVEKSSSTQAHNTADDGPHTSGESVPNLERGVSILDDIFNVDDVDIDVGEVNASASDDDDDVL